MLNIYRVISLSIVMSLFFAAPLLCIHPVTYQLRSEQRQRLVANDTRARKAKVIVKRGSRIHSFRPADALATSLYRSVNGAEGLPYKSEDQEATPAVFVQNKDEVWYDHDNLDAVGTAVPAESSDQRATSHSSLYY